VNTITPETQTSTQVNDSDLAPCTAYGSWHSFKQAVIGSGTPSVRALKGLKARPWLIIHAYTEINNLCGNISATGCNNYIKPESFYWSHKQRKENPI